MKMRFILFLYLVGSVFILQNSATSQNVVDPRTRILTRKQWLQEASKTKINSQMNILLLGQAFNSKLSYLAFEHYEAIKKSQPKNPYAALYYGQAGRFYFQELLVLPSDPTGKRQKAMRVADENLDFATKNLPDSFYAHMVYGYFLWQFYSQMDRGLTMVLKAQQLNPKSANVVSVLGLMHSNRGGNCYNLDKSEQYYRSAILLDPSLASARYGLHRVLKERGKTEEAKTQLLVALSLTAQSAKK